MFVAGKYYGYEFTFVHVWIDLVSHSWYWDEKDHKELSVEAGGINSDTVDTALSGRYNGRYGNLKTAKTGAVIRTFGYYSGTLTVMFTPTTPTVD